MIGICKVCRQLIDGGRVPVVGEQTAAAEFLLLAEALRAHVYARHRDAVAPYGGLIQFAVCYLSSLFGDASEESEFHAQRAVLLEAVIERLRAARVEAVKLPAGSNAH